MLTVASNFLGLMSSQLQGGLTAFFPGAASGGYLQISAVYTYGIPATLLSATFGTGYVTLTNAGGAIYTQAAGSVTVSNTATASQYTNTTGFTLGAFSSITIPVQCTISGSAGNSSPGTVTNMVTSLSGVTVTNALAIIGLNAPTDAQVLAMCLASLAIRSVRGPRNAYSYAISLATNAVTGNPVNINRSTVTADHSGNVSILLASPAGAPDPNDVIGVQTSVQANVVPTGVTATSIAATAVSYAPTISPTVIAPANVSPVTIQAAIANAIANYISYVFPVGGITANDDSHPFGFTGVLASGIYGAAAVGCASVGATLVSLAGATDLALTSSQVATDGVIVNPPTVVSNLN
jgi:hypothetical protein